MNNVNVDDMLKSVHNLRDMLDKKRERTYKDIQIALWVSTVIFFVLSTVSGVLGLSIVREMSFGIGIELVGAWATLKLIEKVWSDNDLERETVSQFLSRVATIARKQSQFSIYPKTEERVEKRDVSRSD